MSAMNQITGEEFFRGNAWECEGAGGPVRGTWEVVGFDPDGRPRWQLVDLEDRGACEGCPDCDGGYCADCAAAAEELR